MRNPEPRNGVLPSCPPPTRSPGRGVEGSHLRSPSPPHFFLAATSVTPNPISFQDLWTCARLGEGSE